MQHSRLAPQVSGESPLCFYLLTHLLTYFCPILCRFPGVFSPPGGISAAVSSAAAASRCAGIDSARPLAPENAAPAPPEPPAPIPAMEKTHFTSISLYSGITASPLPTPSERNVYQMIRSFSQCEQKEKGKSQHRLSRDAQISQTRIRKDEKPAFEGTGKGVNLKIKRGIERVTKMGRNPPV